MKAFVLNNSGRRKELGCLQRREQLNKVEVKNRTTIPVLICCFSVLLSHYSCKNSAYDRDIFIFSTYINGYIRRKLARKQEI